MKTLFKAFSPRMNISTTRKSTKAALPILPWKWNSWRTVCGQWMPKPEQHRALEQDAAQIKTDRALTGALIERLIDRIEVSHNKQITVRYRFQSEFETYAEVLEQCRNM